MKNKKLPIIIIISILIVILATAIVIAILYNTTDIFKSYDVLFAKYFNQNEELLSILENANYEEQKLLKNTNGYTSSGELLINIQDGTVNTQKVKATTASRHDLNTNRTYSEIILKNGESDLIKMSYINSGDVYAIKYEDVLANYIGIRNLDLKTFAKNMGMSDTDVANIPNAIDFASLNSITDITNDQKQYIKETYLPVIINNIDKNSYTKTSKSQISVDGVDYVTNAYTVTIDANTFKQIIISCLTTLKNDNTTLTIISNKLSSLNPGSDSTIDTSMLSQTIDTLIQQLEGTDANENEMKITTYENKGTTIRTMIELSNISKITIDKLAQNNSKKVILTIGESESTTSDNTTEQTNNTTSAVQVILEQITTDSEVLDNITVIPDTSDTSGKITMNTSMGKVLNGTINNTSSVSIENANQTVDALYTQTIQTASQVEEILELKNSNTVIVNNYSKEQLLPFLQSLGNRIKEIVPNKIEQLGIDIGLSQTNTGASANYNDISNNLQSQGKAVGIIATSGLAVANQDNINIRNIATALFTLMSYTNNQQKSLYNTIEESNNEQQKNNKILNNEIQILQNT